MFNSLLIVSEMAVTMSLVSVLLVIDGGLSLPSFILRMSLAFFSLSRSEPMITISLFISSRVLVSSGIGPISSTRKVPCTFSAPSSVDSSPETTSISSTRLA